jgi:hypothetical protein
MLGNPLTRYSQHVAELLHPRQEQYIRRLPYLRYVRSIMARRDGICQVAGQAGTITRAVCEMAWGLCAEVLLSGLRRLINAVT